MPAKETENILCSMKRLCTWQKFIPAVGFDNDYLNLLPWNVRGSVSNQEINIQL